jgi:hypothetical protein
MIPNEFAIEVACPDARPTRPGDDFDLDRTMRPLDERDNKDDLVLSWARPIEPPRS